MAGHTITPCLWFDTQAEEAARYYVSVFRNAKLGTISRYPEAGYKIHGKKPGSVLTAEFEIDGQKFVALNGGPQFTFDEAVSFQVHCDSQDEVDYYWEKLSEGGEEGPCGWLKDRFGLSWQIVPRALPEMLAAPEADKRDRVMTAMLQMRKIDIAALERARDGETV